MNPSEVVSSWWHTACSTHVYHWGLGFRNLNDSGESTRPRQWKSHRTNVSIKTKGANNSKIKYMNIKSSFRLNKTKFWMGRKTWLKKKKKTKKKNLWDQVKRSENLSWWTLWCDRLKNMNATLVFVNINHNFSNMVSEHVQCTLYWPDHFRNIMSNLGLHFKRDNYHLENAQEMQPGG